MDTAKQAVGKISGEAAAPTGEGDAAAPTGTGEGNAAAPTGAGEGAPPASNDAADPSTGVGVPAPPAATPRARDFPLRLPAPSEGTLRIRAPEQHYVPKLLERDGLAGYERETMACFLAAAERLDGALFDIGANTGVFSLVAAAVLQRPAVAFEPTPDLAQLLRTHLGYNDLSDVVVEQAALGATPGSATLYLSNVTDSSNSLLEGFRPSEASIEVRVDTLDGYLAATGRRPGLLKIDTEATEPDVLRGAAHLLRDLRPWLICEVLAGRTETELEDLLDPLGYHWFQITGEVPLVPRREIFGDRTYRYSNWLFTPEPPDDDFWAGVRSWSRALAACTPIAPEPPPARPAPPAPRPRRKRGVYGRKKMLAGIVGGIVGGMAVGTVVGRTARRPRDPR